MTETEFLIQTLKAQRNDALDRVAYMNVQINVMQLQINDLTKELAARSEAADVPAESDEPK